MSPPPPPPPPTPAPAANGHANGGSMRGAAASLRGGPFLERRRFRTWEQDTQAPPSRRWAVVLRFSALRTLRTWYLASLLALAVLLAAIGLVAFSYDAINGTNKDAYAAAAGMFLVMPTVFLLLVGAPLLAEDVRFNAPLFYFSRPLRTVDYLLGKCLHAFGLVAATGLVPIVLFCLMVLLIGVHDVSPTDPYTGDLRSDEEMAALSAQRIDGVGEALYAAFVTILGAASVLFFATSAMIACSAYTRRAWHAAMAFVAILGCWSLLGVFAIELVKGAGQHLFGPAGWGYLVLGAPMDAFFAQPPLPSYLRGAGLAIPLAHLLLIGTGIGSLRLAQRRLRRLEGLL